MQTAAQSKDQSTAVAPRKLYTAADLLDLISAVREHDPGAASHVLFGLLRMAANGHATAVEQTSMRIAGLADLRGNEFVLTPSACGILDEFSNGDYVSSGPRRSHDTAHDILAHEPSPAIANNLPEPIARLRIGTHDYVIGEIEALEMLAFRPQEGGEWIELSNTVENGWSSIASEIIKLTFDTTREYIRMHMIQRRDLDMGKNIEAFDLYGFEWYIRLEDTKSEVRLGGQNWSEFDRGDLDPVEKIKFVAVEGLLSVLTDPRAMFGKDIDAWARRIAAGASVMPAFTI